MRKWVESPEHCQLAVLSKLVMTMMVEERNKYHISALHASLLLPPTSCHLAFFPLVHTVPQKVCPHTEGHVPAVLCPLVCPYIYCKEHWGMNSSHWNPGTQSIARL